MTERERVSLVLLSISALSSLASWKSFAESAAIWSLWVSAWATWVSACASAGVPAWSLGEAVAAAAAAVQVREDWPESYPAFEPEFEPEPAPWQGGCAGACPAAGTMEMATSRQALARRLSVRNGRSFALDGLGRFFMAGSGANSRWSSSSRARRGRFFDSFDFAQVHHGECVRPRGGGLDLDFGGEFNQLGGVFLHLLLTEHV